MQKTPLTGSILIWSIFLSLIISVSFIGISSKIHKKLNRNHIYSQANNTKNNISKILASTGFLNTNLENNKTLIFDHSGIYSLQKNESITFTLPASTTIQITSLSESQLSYQDTNTHILLPSVYSQAGLTGNIIITGLSGHNKFQLLSSQIYQQLEKNYVITQQIGNQNVIQNYGSIIKK